MATAPLTTDALVGRDAELESIRAFLTRSTAGALLLEGEAGIGKTTLVAAAVADATERGWRVLECRPAAAEAQLPFGALADALGDAVDEVIPALPAPQRTALLGALHRIEADVDRLALSRGNPFFALELAAAAATASDGGALPVPETVRELVQRRLAALPKDARGGLLVVAALGHPATDVLAHAVEDWQRVVAPALDAGILEVRSGRIGFAHPLLASGVYGGAAEHERRAVHDMLARVVPDPEQRAWHLAHATARADEDVATTLERAAAGAAVRGAPETAAELAEHAHRLTPREHLDERASRALQTATYAWAAGDAT